MTKPIIDETAVSSVETGIVIRDLEPMLRFYHDVIGLEPYGEVDLGYVHVRGFKIGNTILKLTAFADPVVAPRVEGFAPGLRYITFKVTNIEDIYNTCVEYGCAVWLPLETVTSEEGVTYKHAGVSDPDGNNVEFVQGMPYAPPSREFARGQLP